MLSKRDPQSGQVLRSAGLDFLSLTQIGRDLIFESPVRLSSATTIGSCSIGAFSYAGPGSEIRNATIGRFCSIAANVAIGPAEHPVDWVSTHPVGFNGVRYFDNNADWSSFASVNSRFRGNGNQTTVGNDVWIGRNAVIRQGITVGHGAVIAAGAFVNRDVPPYTIVGGIPATPIRQRFEKSIADRLLASNWWNWRLDAKEHNFDYEHPELFLELLERLLNERRLLPFNPPKHRLTASADGHSLRPIEPAEHSNARS